MRLYILTLLAVAAISSGAHCTQQDTYHVDSQGNVSKGASKEKTQETIYFKGHMWSEDGCNSMNKLPGVNSIILR